MGPKIVLLGSVVAGVALLHASAAVAVTETVLHNFGVSASDGVLPVSGLVSVKGTLYGTTVEGGVSTRCEARLQPGCGTVFSITQHGSYKVLHSFKGGRDGELPTPVNLINVNGTLFGTTLQGGTGQCYINNLRVGCGTVFSITPRGKEAVVYSFKGGSDGYQPISLLNVNGTIYGTTVFGGTGTCVEINGSGCGTVFSIAPDGTETVVHSFAKGRDGSEPWGNLIEVGGTLYGTTYFGGTGNCSAVAGSGCGTVFAITPHGKEKVLYSFQGGRDGANSSAGLIDVQGTLYGTTFFGGNLAGDGTVFSITPSGTETVLYRFGSGGGAPLAGLLNVKGIMYGTGAYGSRYRSGIVFSIATSGAEKTVYRFKSSDGLFPQANLIKVNGTLYGTTPEGGSTFYEGGCPGAGGFGCGVVFSIKP